MPNTLTLGAPVSPGVANRLNNIIDTQPYGALGAIGVGIIENADGTSLLVEAGAGLFVEVSAGDAIVQSPVRLGRASKPVWGRSQGDPALPVAPNQTLYVCAQLVYSASLGDPDADEGTALLKLVALESDTTPGTLVLATVVTSDSGIVSVTPSALYIKPDQALKKLLQVIADLGYDDTARNFGSVASRLSKLEGRTSDDGGEEPPAEGLATKLELNAVKSALAQLRTDFETYKATQSNDSVVGVTETPSSLLVNQGKMMGTIVHLDPTAAQHFVAGIDIPDATGDAQRWNNQTAGVVRIGGNATYDEKDGSIHG